ncbi:GIY-YIG nuclease family protein [Bacillus sp. OK048]|uniref:GIY-YIG nuclease family protein n=1 Tax=Bacillus sp. OK048 TaxID=1882761 RepID=UPI00088BAF6C|nr:GIY-YIG nuclease family protein [Bacillus sp. OK048]SDN85683.1 GIY-YIG catalytic domain-containing protein [Bacillus sp. OK048]
MSLFKSLVSAAVKQVNKVNSFEFVKNNAPNEIGVYIMKLNGKVMYVGRAIENRDGQSTRGLRKRLQEHWRGAGNCKPELYQNRDQLTVTLKVCSSVEEAKRLEGQLIRQYNTVENGWNLRYEEWR